MERRHDYEIENNYFNWNYDIYLNWMYDAIKDVPTPQTRFIGH